MSADGDVSVDFSDIDVDPVGSQVRRNEPAAVSRIATFLIFFEISFEGLPLRWVLL